MKSLLTICPSPLLASMVSFFDLHCAITALLPPMASTSMSVILFLPFLTVTPRNTLSAPKTEARNCSVIDSVASPRFVEAMCLYWSSSFIQ